MENEILQQLLKGQEQIFSELKELRQGQHTMQGDISDLKQGQIHLEQGQAKLEQGLSGLEKRATKTELMIENTVIPQIHLLAEGHAIIQDQIKHLSVIDAMQDDIATLKTAVKFLSHELDELRKAI